MLKKREPVEICVGLLASRYVLLDAALCYISAHGRQAARVTAVSGAGLCSHGPGTKRRL